ncbi:MAG: zinc ribbon domain-containing protein [Lachnospiraceae bacterium]|nr:zinc ribbon domain-containing protein [Lachnospiraceae bacterium]
MAFFNDLQRNLSSAGKQAADKAKEIADLTMKTAELRGEEQKLEACYARIGKRLYETTKEVPAEEDLDDFNEIEAHLNNMKNIEAEIQELKGKIPCPNCGEMVDAGSKFCNYCGTNM